MWGCFHQQHKNKVGLSKAQNQMMALLFSMLEHIGGTGWSPWCVLKVFVSATQHGLNWTYTKGDNNTLELAWELRFVARWRPSRHFIFSWWDCSRWTRKARRLVVGKGTSTWVAAVPRCRYPMLLQQGKGQGDRRTESWENWPHCS